MRHATAGVTAASLEDRYMDKLDALKRCRLEGELTRYFSGMEALLREYFRDKYRIGSIEEWRPQTSTAAGPDERTAAVARELLGVSHQVRYAGHTPNEREQTRMFDFLRTMFNRNQPRRPAPEEEQYFEKETHQ
jgi:hypothetical protein